MIDGHAQTEREENQREQRQAVLKHGPSGMSERQPVNVGHNPSLHWASIECLVALRATRPRRRGPRRLTLPEDDRLKYPLTHRPALAESGPELAVVEAGHGGLGFETGRTEDQHDQAHAEPAGESHGPWSHDGWELLSVTLSA